MAGTFTPTGNVYSNLTRLELEQLRKADFYAGSKALTVGDGDGIVGAGSINAEPYYTAPAVALDSVYTQTPPGLPGIGLATQTQLGIPSETVQWIGPNLVTTGNNGHGLSATQWEDTSPGLDFTVLGVAVNDILLVKDTSTFAATNNQYVAATITGVTATVLTCSDINGPLLGTPGAFDFVGLPGSYQYVIIRPNAAQLFAVPGSGPLGQEQTFLMVIPGSTLHTTLGPTLGAINADRITNLSAPVFAGGTGVDRADSVFGPPNTAGPRGALDSLGYRVVLYKSNAAGTGVDLTQPIATLSPVIDSTIPAADQRMTIDYKAGVVRFSCAPRAGDDIKPLGGTQGTNPTTGRLQLYAVFWAVDQTFTQGASRSVYAMRTDTNSIRNPGKIFYSGPFNDDGWHIGATTGGTGFFVQARDASEEPATDATDKVSFGTMVGGFGGSFRGFRIRQSDGIPKFIRRDLADSYDPQTTLEMTVADKTAFTVGDGASPPQNPGGDFNPAVSFWNSGYREIDVALGSALTTAAYGGYGTVHLRRGNYEIKKLTYLPPGVEVEGEGASTVLRGNKDGFTAYQPMFKIGPNTKWGVYDFTADSTGGTVTPSEINHIGGTRIEGVDIVWNSLRRVWAIFQADLTTNSVWFNEMRTDGSFVLPGLGIDIKGTPSQFFKKPNSTNSTHHTTGHYPRAAFHLFRGDYAVVWVEEQAPGGTVGPIIKLQLIHYEPGGTTPTTTYVKQYPGGAVSISPSPGLYPYTTHPSVAVDSTEPSTFYKIAISGWAYDATLTNSAMMATTIQAFSGFPFLFQMNVAGSQAVVSSSDVVDWQTSAAGSNNEFLFSWSVRKHALLEASDGVTTLLSSTLTSATYPTWSTAGVEIGSRVVIRSGTDAGRQGWVRQISPASTLIVQMEGSSTSLSGAAGVAFSIAPLCRVFVAQTSGNGVSFGSSVRFAGPNFSGSFTNGVYYPQEREPDYVRLSRGGDKAVLVYQTFDTNAQLNRPFMKNFDNGINPLMLADQPDAFLGSLQTFRQHLATRYILVPLQTNPAAQLPADVTAFIPSGTATIYTKARDFESTLNTLGGHSGMTIPFANEAANTFNEAAEVSARNSYALYPAPMIPDVTWTGTDWTIVSPPVSQHIKSDTGKYQMIFGSPYFSDPSFYFGMDNVISDGIQLRRTVQVGDAIYFPSSGEYLTIADILSEHAVLLSAPSGVIVSGTIGLTWFLIRNHSYGKTAGVKNAGFRLNRDGKVISRTNYLTWADEPTDGQTGIERHTAMMYRNLFGNIDFSITPDTQRLGQTKLQWMDLLDNQRLMGDVSFRGVAVGAPKGLGQALPDENANVAIAWGENFYAFADRILDDTVNKMAVYRQTFGPYRNKISNLRMEARGNSTKLTIETKRKVYTRHGGSASPNPYFGTDGYRNVFMQWAIQSTTRGFNSAIIPGILDYQDSRDDRAYLSHISSVWTDQVGNGPVRRRELGSPQGFPRSLMSTVTGRTEQANGTRILWTGKEFLAVVASNDGLFLFSLPGDEGSQDLHDEITGDFERELFYMFFQSGASIVGNATIQCGYGGLERGPKGDPATYPGTADVDRTVHDAVDIILIDAAWSGKVLAVAWVAGLNSTASGNAELGGTVMGVTFFTPGGGGFGSGGASNASTYTLDFERGASTKNRIRDPKIVWDGSSFMVSYVRRDFSGNFQINALSLPEEGPFSRMEMKRIRPLNQNQSTGYLQAFGQVNSDGTININNANAQVYVQPGDMIYIARSGLNLGGAGNYAATAANFHHGSGFYTVTHVDANSGRIDVGVDLTLAFTSGAYLYGAIIHAGGQSPNSNIQDYDYQGSGTIASGPSTSPGNFLTFFEGTTVLTVSSLWATLYNEANDEYVSFYTAASGVTYATVWKKNLVRRKEVQITTDVVGHMSVAWNGSRYFFVYVTGTSTTKMGVLDADLRMEVDPAFNIFALGSNLVGNTPEKVPGPGHGPYSASWTPDYAIRGVHAAWNNRLGRWLVSASIMWVSETTPNARYAAIAPVRSAGWTLTGWTNRSLSISGSNNFRQPGIRVVGTQYVITGNHSSNRINDNQFLTSQNLAGFDSVTAFADANVTQNVDGTNINSKDDNYLGQTESRVVDVNNSTLGTSYRRRLTKDATRDGNVVDHLYLEGALYPTIATGHNYNFIIYDVTSRYIFNVQSANGVNTNPILIDTSVNESNNVVAPVTNTDMQYFIMAREDVFLWTISMGPAAIEVLDADDITLENLDISGEVDISERMRNLARPHWQNGGFAIGVAFNGAGADPNGNANRSHVVPVFTVPYGKVPELRLTNVRSHTGVSYGWTPTGYPERRLLNKGRR